MDVSSVLEGLNSEQREVVAAPAGNILVLAGAGSGKTRVLVHRIAWYLQTEQAAPFGILAVTFTNKAAAEMRARIETLLKRPIGGMWVGTFHGLAHRFLRLHWQEAGLNDSFQILDSEDQLRALRRIIRSMNLDENQYSPREAQWFINAKKEEGLRPQHIELHSDHILERMVAIYRNYQQTCDRSGLVDFAELLLRTHELFRDQDNLLQHYRQRFRHILVDEFQDTNTLQYAWLRLLAGADNHLFAVGDDDQSIYSFRGARMENMQRFQQDFPEPSLFRLEQNYRSTTNILNAANALIANNTTRLGKNLWAEGRIGEKLELYAAYNEHDEARFVVERISAARQNNVNHQDNAILYRVSATSRVLEEALMQAQVPYRVFGGMRFYERMEIKDALAYLRLAANRDDDASFERIVNTPPRGIGQRSLEEIRGRARGENIPLWQAASALVTDKLLPSRSLAALERFLGLIEQTAQAIRGKEPDEAMDIAIGAGGLVEHYRKEKGERGLSRVENLEELVSAAGQFEVDEDVHGEMDPLAAFLSQAALEAGDTQADAGSDAVNLMTLHTAKGLEFDRVYLVGMEEGLFPHQRSSGDPAQLEEERRLCYVGVTRARKKLTLSYARHRRMHGAEFYPQPSRFLGEIPAELIDDIRLGGAVTSDFFNKAEPDSDTPFGPGQRVVHNRFGEGTVLNLEGRGSHARIQVNFERAGAKWLVLAYANLQPA